MVAGGDVDVLATYGNSVAIPIQRAPGRDLWLARVADVDYDQLIPLEELEMLTERLRERLEGNGIHTVQDVLAKTAEELCPDAWLINYINPTAANGIGLRIFAFGFSDACFRIVTAISASCSGRVPYSFICRWATREKKPGKVSPALPSLLSH